MEHVFFMKHHEAEFPEAHSGESSIKASDGDGFLTLFQPRCPKGDLRQKGEMSQLDSGSPSQPNSTGRSCILLELIFQQYTFI